jgi:hypothetical protein
MSYLNSSFCKFPFNLMLIDVIGNLLNHNKISFYIRKFNYLNFLIIQILNYGFFKDKISFNFIVSVI